MNRLTNEGNSDSWDAPPTSPKFTGFLRLSRSGRDIIRKLLDLPGGLQFSKITASYPIGNRDLVNELVSMCSDTLESLCVDFDRGAFSIGSVVD